MNFIIFLLGAVAGSFLNVLIYRLPRGEEFLFSRSHCARCGQTIPWHDLIPLVSFAFLRGRCRRCGAAISWQYPIIELTSGLLFILLWKEPFFLFAAEILLAVAVIDLLHFIIPDILLVTLSLGALAYSRDIYGVLTGVACASFFFLLWYFSKGKWIGLGDVKLAGALGLIFGFPDAVIAIYTGIIAGGLLGAILLLLNKATRKTKLPLGTFFVLGSFVLIFFQDYIHEISAGFFTY